MSVCTRSLGVLITSFGLFCLGHQACAHEGHDHGAAAVGDQPKTLTARGVVFDDRNKNGTRDEGEPGIRDVRVSNGLDLVRTDSDGRYEIKIDNDEIIFVVKPRGWMTPVSELQLPNFYYVHKPAGSPPGKTFAGVVPTGPLPESVDFPLHRHDEPDRFKALMFGDPQSRNVEEVEYMTHDVIEQIVAAEGHDASFGVTLGDIVFDDLDVFGPHNRAIALIGIPWYNVIGNHDVNRDATADEFSDETFESIYGPAYYSFDYGPTHFLVLDNIDWIPAAENRKPKYEGGFGEQQLQFIKNDLAIVPKDQLVVLMMHVPLTETTDNNSLYRLIEQRPATVSLSAHRHFMEHRLIGKEDGWQGPKEHHHIINVTVCGSWWGGQKDERGIPHAMMSDGGPNGYTIMEFDGKEYSLDFRAAGRPADYQMSVHVPETIGTDRLAETPVLANVFNAPPGTEVDMRIKGQTEWSAMKQTRVVDPKFVATKIAELSLIERASRDLPAPYRTPHMWITDLPPGIAKGTHLIEIRASKPDKSLVTGMRVIRVTDPMPREKKTNPDEATR